MTSQGGPCSLSATAPSSVAVAMLMACVCGWGVLSAVVETAAGLPVCVRVGAVFGDEVVFSAPVLVRPPLPTPEVSPGACVPRRVAPPPGVGADGWHGPWHRAHPCHRVQAAAGTVAPRGRSGCCTTACLRPASHAACTTAGAHPTVAATAAAHATSGTPGAERGGTAAIRTVFGRGG
jgi:hypothetical protein